MINVVVTETSGCFTCPIPVPRIPTPEMIAHWGSLWWYGKNVVEATHSGGSVMDGTEYPKDACREEYWRGPCLCAFGDKP